MKNNDFIKKTRIIKIDFLKIYISVLLFILTLSSLAATKPTEKEVSDSYLYLLGRYLVIRQENQDINTEKIGYNKIKYNPLGSAEFVNPNMDVAYLESWIAVDKDNAVIINVPKIEKRYYTVQVLDGWGEVITNINERNYPNHPYGKFAFVLKGSNPKNIPENAVKIEIPSNKIKILARVELQRTPSEAVKLQKQFTLEAPNNIKIESPIKIPNFTNKNLIGSDIFLNVDKILASYPDSMPKSAEYQKTVKKVADYMKNSSDGKKYIENIIQEKTIPEFMKKTLSFGEQKNGWSVMYVAGNFGNDFVLRDVVNYTGIWANTAKEVIYFGGTIENDTKRPLNGSNTYSITFLKDNLPDLAAEAFWSVTLYSTPDFHVVKNSINKYGLNNVSDLQKNADGSLSIWISPSLPEGVLQSNWIPSEKEKDFALNLRMYVPKQKVLNGTWLPPEIKKMN